MIEKELKGAKYLIFNAGRESALQSRNILRKICKRFQYVRDEVTGVQIYRTGKTLFVFNVSGISATWDILHQLEYKTFEKAIFIGSAGGLREDINVGDFIIPAEIELAKLNYLLDRSAIIPEEKIVVRLLKKTKGHYGRSGSVFSIYCPVDDIRELKKRGCVSIDIESGIVMAFCAEKKITAATLLYCSDSIVKEDDETQEEKQKRRRKSRFKANRIALEVIKKKS